MHQSSIIKKRNGLIIITFILIIAIVSSIFFGKSEVKINPLYSFSELSYMDYVLEEHEKDNVYSILDSLVVEDSYVFGFSNDSNVTIDLNKANSVTYISRIFSSHQNDSLKTALSFLEHIDFQKLDFLNLTYYISLCLNLKISVDYTAIEKALSKYYDPLTDLFFIDGIEDAVSDKLIATAIVKRSLGDTLNTMFFDLKNGILKAYESFPFDNKNGITLYNSGGCVLYCMSVFDMESKINKEDLKEWFNYWKQIYESNKIESIVTALQYSEYLNIAKIFDPQYSNIKLQDYYNAMTEQDIENLEDLYMLYNIAINITPEENYAIVTAIQKKIDKVIVADELFYSNIDVQSTVFGVVLARKVNYPLNINKIKNLIERNYEEIPDIDNTYDRTLRLYYNIILDQLINGYDRLYNDNYIQTQINSILETIKFDTTVAADIVSTRRLVEIVMDMQIFNTDIKITNNQRRQINRGVKKSIQDNIISNSVLINDIFIIDRTLSLNTISNQTFIKVFNSLNVNGGVLAIDTNDLVPDILTTYQFIVMLERIGYKINLNEHKNFIKSLEKERGLYTSDATTANTTNLTVISYANAIKYLEFGGDKINDYVK